jgi:hypothetical protein
MSKMGSHDPFGYLKHKLWRKEWSKVKLSIWFPTIKSWELPWFTCVYMACHISLKISWEGLQLYFKFHLQSHGSLNFEIFEIPKLKILRQNDIWMWAPWSSTKNTTRGRWWLPPSPGHREFCESVFARGSSVHQKCPNYALTNLLFGLCKFVWVIDPLVICPSPHPKVITHLSTPEMLRTKERTPIHYPSIVFTFWIVIESIKKCGHAS